jgi:hypothetical protein
MAYQCGILSTPVACGCRIDGRIGRSLDDARYKRSASLILSAPPKSLALSEVPQTKHFNMQPKVSYHVQKRLKVYPTFTR